MLGLLFPRVLPPKFAPHFPAGWLHSHANLARVVVLVRAPTAVLPEIRSAFPAGLEGGRAPAGGWDRDDLAPHRHEVNPAEDARGRRGNIFHFSLLRLRGCHTP